MISTFPAMNTINTSNAFWQPQEQVQAELRDGWWFELSVIVAGLLVSRGC